MAFCQGTTLQAAEELIPLLILKLLVSGHDFSRAEKAAKIAGLYKLRKNSFRS
jgi:hypothetical protein